MSLEDDRTRGQKAEKLINDAMFIEAFDLTRQAIISKWEAWPIADHAGAHELKLMLKLLTDVRANLEQAIADGKLATVELQQEREAEERNQRLASVRNQSPRDFRAIYPRR